MSFRFPDGGQTATTRNFTKKSDVGPTLVLQTKLSGHDGVDARDIVGAAARPDDEAAIGPDDGAADEPVVVATVDVTRWASFLLLCSIIYELIHEIVLFILM